jgi:hypothetical protein
MVVSLGWDDSRSTLYAALDYDYKTRMGHYLDYRRAKIPQEKDSMDVDDTSNGEADSYGDDDDDYDDEPRCWPKRAYHQEGYFDYTFDVGRHGISRFYSLHLFYSS